jgi:putative phage-type endonuclease
MIPSLLDLEPLEDILDTLVFEDEPNIFSEEYAVEIVETALHLMEEYMAENPTAISDPNFHDTLLEEIKDIFYVQIEDHILNSDYVEDDMNDLLEVAFNIYVTSFQTERSITNVNIDVDINVDADVNHNNNNNNNNNTNNLDIDVDLEKVYKDKEEKIQKLRDIPQPIQRTPEWYQFRWNLITASNAWKAFESQNAINQLIYEKCQPVRIVDEENDEENKIVNTNTTLHWGQKYEPLSVMIYEDKYKSKVEDFGCIQHPTYKFIGASPDGIIIESCTGRYGRMLEIKNVVSREITGIPKKEYWVQMQLQMEVCDLDECDFLETKFTEYPDYLSFKNDSSTEVDNCTRTKNGDFKGIIVHFHKKDGSPHYEYMPLHLSTANQLDSWGDSTFQKYESAPYNYIFIKFIYWKLEKLSCVLVLRNKAWFKNNVGQLEKVWKIIEEERVTGYQHRAPNKKLKKDTPSKPYVDAPKEICYLKVIKTDT